MYDCLYIGIISQEGASTSWAGQILWMGPLHLTDNFE